VTGAEPKFAGKQRIGKVELNRNLAATGFKVRSADIVAGRCGCENLDDAGAANDISDGKPTFAAAYFTVGPHHIKITG
jgi:hypothetical protein